MKQQIIRNTGIVAVILLVLILAFMVGEKPADKKTKENVPKEGFVQTTAVPAASSATIITEQTITFEKENVTEKSEEDRTDFEENYVSDGSATAEPSEMEEPRETVAVTEPSCTLSICCEEVLKNSETLTEEKRGTIPLDGWILKEETVLFTEGETVFDLLLRETKNRGIHFEFVYTPMYHSAYIEGIGNLYEFDCGDTSGWFYKVNGEKPMFGCSQYVLKQGDKVEFVYTCNYFNAR